MDRDELINKMLELELEDLDRMEIIKTRIARIGNLMERLSVLIDDMYNYENYPNFLMLVDEFLECLGDFYENTTIDYQRIKAQNDLMLELLEYA